MPSGADPGGRPSHGSLWFDTLERPGENVRPPPPLPADVGVASGAASARRRWFDPAIWRTADAGSDEPREFALASIGIDPFEAGLAGGGLVADRIVAERVEHVLQADCGGEDAWLRLDLKHFSLLLSGAGLAAAHVRAERLLRRCAAEGVAFGGRTAHFTVSVGVASHPHTARDRQSLLTAAAQAREHAAERGGNQVALAAIRFDG